MLELFNQLPNGAAEMAKQYSDVFPDEKMFRPEWDINKARNLLNPLIAALLDNKELTILESIRNNG